MESVHKFAPELSAAELVSYAPTAGNPELRAKWQEKLLEKNPGLNGKKISLPVVVPGLTAGISYLSDLFVDEKHPLLAADPSWDNYALIVETRRNSELHQFKMFIFLALLYNSSILLMWFIGFRFHPGTGTARHYPCEAHGPCTRLSRCCRALIR